MRPRDTDVGAEVGAADECRPGAGVGPPLVGAAHAELENRGALRRLANPRGLGRHQGLVVEVVEHRSLDELRHGQRPVDDDQGHVRVDHPTLGNGTDRQAFHGAVSAQPVEKGIIEETIAGRTLQRPKIGHILGSRGGFPHPVEKPLETGEDRIAGRMLTVVRVRSEKIVELDPPLGQPVTEVELGHGELVEVGEEETLGEATIAGHGH